MDVCGPSGFSTPAGLALHQEICPGPPDLRQVVGTSLRYRAQPPPQRISVHLPPGLTPQSLLSDYLAVIWQPRPEIGQIAAPCYVHLPGRRPNLSPGKAPGASCPPVTPLDFCAFLNHRVWETAGESVNKLRKSQLALSFELRIKSELCSWPTRRHVTWGSSPPLSPSPAFLFPVHADSFPQRRLCPCRCLCPRGS